MKTHIFNLILNAAWSKKAISRGIRTPNSPAFSPARLVHIISKLTFDLTTWPRDYRGSKRDDLEQDLCQKL